MSRSVVTAPRPRSAPTGRRRLLATGLAIAGLIGTLVLDAPAAQAATYPSWDDVVAARGKESAKQSQIVEIRGIISGLSEEVDSARAEAERLGAAFEAAQRKALRAAEKEQSLREDAEDHAEVAEASAAQAGRFAAQMARSGGADVTTSVLTGGEDARDLLYDLGALSKLSEQAERVETAATNDASVARSLTDQADRAALALEDLAQAAQDRMSEAQAASDRAQAAYDEQEANKSRLEAQLASLTSGRATTEAQYEKGERIRKAEEERRRKALEAELARQQREQAAAAAAAANQGGGGGGGAPVSSGGGAAPGSGSGSGWVRPAGGWITSGYGVRVNPVSGVVRMHDGIDLGSGCSTAIVAASSGTVDYVGPYGGYGNYVRIDHGGGVKTAYGHIVNGGFRVSPGQQVSAGTLIALVGSTGNSTGCHLHFETHVGGGTVDPVSFMGARGVGF
ncbi:MULTISPECIES: M23 family metallopeptidase [unclassified Curtobacterium]|uniref:M23 family metallopeptidase n=1 Tax=unclassified Curtobacterium TaxID=257496 RepID=UPI000DAABFE1|nr:MULTISPECIES: M23 family metallopeptidase [unclassified Curtobacterium]PZE63543.1 M23 family peptidase [Curtobacterium sp. MCBD17_021]WIB26970.1 peptidoglycan DD-metalloendopeptidase family protein [Curtobacterium sp. MCSS17_015]